MVIKTHSTRTLHTPDGMPLKEVEQITYLGGLITNKMSARPEMTRRLGEAARAFKPLGMCWSHANISKQQKVEILTACIASKVFHNIETLWLLKCD